LFQERVWKPSEEEEQTPEGKLASIRRGFGKDAILGCGYGMGAAKFFKRCYSNEALRPLFDSGEYDEAFVQRLVDTYRTRYACIPLYWRSVERAWRVATKYGQIETVGSVKIGNLVTFWHKCGTTFMRLPSGRVMRYRNAAVNSRDELHSSTCINPVTNPYGKLWGGTLTENIDQADCRDALGEWILAVEQELKLHVAHHVYDELVVVVDSNRVDEMKPKILEVMSRCPAWAKGMPYKAEAKVSHHYKK
jgi:DNA polymerase